MLLGRSTDAKTAHKRQLVIQGLHLVSGTHCPACSDQVKEWSESRVAASKGRCPIGHRGEFPNILKGSISKYQVLSILKLDMSVGGQIFGLKSKFEGGGGAGLKPKGQI